MLGHLDIFEYYANKLRDRFENMDAHSPVLMSCFEYPIVASYKVAIWHDVLSR